MMMIFGRSLFGGTTTGRILVAGFAAALATASADPKITRVAKTSSKAVASAQAEALRTVYSEVDAQSSALASPAYCRADFNGLVQAAAACVAVAKPSVEFFLAGEAVATDTFVGNASKRTRIRLATARAYGQAEGEGQVYEIAEASPAKGTATGQGTTDHVGVARGKASAVAQGVPYVAMGIRLAVDGAAEASGWCHREAGAAADAVAEATSLVDATVTKEGVNYVEVVGYGYAYSEASVSSVQVYQNQMARCYAIADAAFNVHHKGAKGKARAISYMRGIAVGTQTGATGIGDSGSRASGYAYHSRGGKGALLAEATAQGKAKAFVFGSGTGQAESVLQSSQVSLRTRGKPALTTATVSALVEKILVSEVLVRAEALASGYMQVNDVLKAPAGRTVVVEEERRSTLVENQSRTVFV